MSRGNGTGYIPDKSNLKSISWPIAVRNSLKKKSIVSYMIILSLKNVMFVYMRTVLY